jgi:hypothetical protein
MTSRLARPKKRERWAKDEQPVTLTGWYGDGYSMPLGPKMKDVPDVSIGRTDTRKLGFLILKRGRPFRKAFRSRDEVAAFALTREQVKDLYSYLGFMLGKTR